QCLYNIIYQYQGDSKKRRILYQGTSRLQRRLRWRVKFVEELLHVNIVGKVFVKTIK
ncbi:hypothetical protein RYX36_031263, partial [Vicia faba]